MTRKPTPAKPDRRGLRCCGRCRVYLPPIEMALRLTRIHTDAGLQWRANPDGRLPGRSVYLCDACVPIARAKPQVLLRYLKGLAVAQVTQLLTEA